jgi:hypothetical protein
MLWLPIPTYGQSPTSRTLLNPNAPLLAEPTISAVPEAANMPPTPWQTEIRAPGIWAGGGAAHLAHALLKGVHAVHAGMHVGEPAAIGVQRQFATWSRIVFC